MESIDLLVVILVVLFIAGICENSIWWGIENQKQAEGQSINGGDALES